MFLGSESPKSHKIGSHKIISHICFCLKIPPNDLAKWHIDSRPLGCERSWRGEQQQREQRRRTQTAARMADGKPARRRRKVNFFAGEEAAADGDDLPRSAAATTTAPAAAVAPDAAMAAVATVAPPAGGGSAGGAIKPTPGEDKQHVVNTGGLFATVQRWRLPARYTDIAHMPSGANADVIRAFDLVTQSRVVIKRPKKPWATAEGARRVFREIRCTFGSGSMLIPRDWDLDSRLYCV